MRNPGRGETATPHTPGRRWCLKAMFIHGRLGLGLVHLGDVTKQAEGRCLLRSKTQEGAALSCLVPWTSRLLPAVVPVGVS
jgi:hypothetical protein